MNRTRLARKDKKTIKMKSLTKLKLTVVKDYHSGSEKFAVEVRMALHLEVIEVVLQAGVCVWVTVGKLVNVVFLIKAERKRHDVILAMFWTSVVVDIAVWNANPLQTLLTI